MNIENVWKKYAAASAADRNANPKKNGRESIRPYVDPSFLAFFLHTLPPGSELVQSARILGARYFGKYSAALDLDFGGFRTWVAFRRIDDHWQLTLEESEILEEVTKEWSRLQLGAFQFITRHPMEKEQICAAEAFTKAAEILQNKMEIPLSLIRYYVAHSPEDAYMVVGQIEKNAGRGRVRSIKTFGRFDHIHELVHVLAMEIGLVNPFFDEGLATAYEEGYRFENQRECLLALERLQTLLPLLLDGGNFQQINLRGKINVYGVAQAAMRSWLKRAGIEKVKKVLKKSVSEPEQFSSHLFAQLGSLDEMIKGTQEELQEACENLKT